MKIQIYTIPNCLYCVYGAYAKKKLQEKGIEFEELDGIDNIEYLIFLNQFEMSVRIKDGKVIKLEEI
jgi:glutaredoxin